MTFHRRPTRPRSAGPSACGFLLLEMMVILGLLAVVALLSAQLYYTTGQALQRISQRQTAQAQFDQSLRQLRADLWGADGVELTSPHTLQIRSADGRVVTWRAADSMQRTTDAPGAAIRHWPDLGANLSFEVRGPTVVMTDDSADQRAQVVILSQSMLLKGRPQ